MTLACWLHVTVVDHHPARARAICDALDAIVIAHDPRAFGAATCHLVTREDETSAPEIWVDSVDPVVLACSRPWQVAFEAAVIAAVVDANGGACTVRVRADGEPDRADRATRST
ncbi:MAG: hypothetical protein NT062_10015 [Proteobacteria bacterium]|nr:hypothetical protein [Pseudomonadota bacterium]